MINRAGSRTLKRLLTCTVETGMQLVQIFLHGCQSGMDHDLTEGNKAKEMCGVDEVDKVCTYGFGQGGPR